MIHEVLGTVSAQSPSCLLLPSAMFTPASTAAASLVTGGLYAENLIRAKKHPFYLLLT